MKRFLTTTLGVAALLCLGRAVADQAQDESAIRKAAQSYADAFNRKDAKSLAEHWGVDAIYTDPSTGKQVTGREAIEKHFSETLGKVKDAKLVVAIDSIQFVSPNVAVEKGKASIVGKGNASDDSVYAAVHVKRDGKWYLDRVTEDDVPVTLSNFDKLKDLEWMVGSWVDDEDDNITIETTCQWSKNQNFLVRKFRVSVDDQLESSGVQIIGWDPAAKQVRSWVFDSEGGFGEGVWTNKGKRWYVQSRDTLPTSVRASATTVITLVDNNRFTSSTINRQAGGQLLPNINEIAIVRKQSNED
jgi:uncharacterized protein (TIGR02246 family)